MCCSNTCTVHICCASFGTHECLLARWATSFGSDSLFTSTAASCIVIKKSRISISQELGGDSPKGEGSRLISPHINRTRGSLEYFEYVMRVLLSKVHGAYIFATSPQINMYILLLWRSKGSPACANGAIGLFCAALVCLDFEFRRRCRYVQQQ